MPPLKENTGAVVITRDPDSGFPQRLANIVCQVDCTLVVDNNSGEQALAMVRDVAGPDCVELVSNPTNLGVATALNQGLSWARERGYVWLLTMDQDSLLLDSAMDVIREVYADVGDSGSIAVVGANYINSRTGEPAYRFETENPRTWTDVTAVITSGSLVSIPIADEVGGFLDELFIDHVDCEYCLRVRQRGFRVIRASEPTIEHIVGNPRMFRFLWTKKYRPDVPSSRLYYQVRNLVYVSRRYWTTEPEWVRWAVRRRLWDVMGVVLCEDNKIAKLWAMVRGLRDGLRNNMGPGG